MKLAIDLLKSFLEFLVILCKCKKLSNIKYFVSPCTTISFFFNSEYYCLLERKYM